jgi:DNA-binding GntR family transcriptional regulator
MYRYRVEYLKRDDSHDTLLAEHQYIIETLEKRNADEAIKAICAHIDNQVTAVADTIRTKK